MIEAAQLKPFLLHEDSYVRDAVAHYFAHSWSQDEDLIPLMLEALERYGPEETAHMLVAAPGLPLSHESLLQLLASLAVATDSPQTVRRLNAILRYLPVPLLPANQDTIQRAPNVLAQTLERLERRRRLADESGPQLWQMLRTFSDENRDIYVADAIDCNYADDLVEALGPRDVPGTPEVCSMMASEEVDEEWLGAFLVDLAGVRRMREAIPQLVAKLCADEGCFPERASEALARIGDPEAARLVRPQFGESTWESRLCAADMLGDLKHEESEQAILALLEAEKDRTVRTFLCAGLCSLFSRAGVDVVRREIASGYDDGATSLEEGLLVVTEVFGADLPERDQWRAEREERTRSLARRKEALSRLGRPVDGLEREPFGLPADAREEPDPDRREVSQPVRRQAAKVGRNDPCPCGSGLKYKKCCGRPQSEPAAAPADDAQHGAAATTDSPMPRPMTALGIERIEYRHGLVETGMSPDDLPTETWTGPAMPPGVRWAIEKERLLELGGVYGDRRAGNPMQYERLRLIGADRAVQITFYNRAIALFTTDTDRVRRIHRVLCKLDDAADGTASEVSR
jgi:hypothetical protein